MKFYFCSEANSELLVCAWSEVSIYPLRETGNMYVHVLRYTCTVTEQTKNYRENKNKFMKERCVSGSNNFLSEY